MYGIVINEDFSHYFYNRGPRGANPEKLREMVSHYCVGQVDEVMFNFMSQRANVTGLNVEPIWYGMEDQGEEGLFFRGKKLDDKMAGWIRCAKSLHEQGIDPYQIWLEETRKQGRRATLSIRMNDCHDIWDEDHFFHAEFWREHPEFRLDPTARETGHPLYWVSALDYTHEEVRAYKINIIRAALERYDTDGLEIDWMRHGLNTGLCNCDAGRTAITEFLRQVRALADTAEKRLGHPVTISARVSATPDDAFARGLDVAQWVREGLVQSIVPTAFFSTSDTGMPIALWRSILGKDAELCAGLELLIRPFPASDHMVESPELLAGQAADYFYQGADRIYLFNHMDSDTGMHDPEQYQAALKTIGTPETVSAAHRRHLITYHDFPTFGMPNASLLPAPLPGNGFSGHLRLFCGPKPEPGRKCSLILGFDSDDAPEMEVRMNSKVLPLLRTFRNEEKEPDNRVLANLQSRQYFPKSSVLLAELDAADAIVSGTNFVLVKNKTEKACCITWCEIDIAPL
ncbi:MAG: hypothetical protein J6Q65_04280 [Lentisphaeria bacterium]|nr:hypothetical protein [Lentisphaeria bacterium]